MADNHNRFTNVRVLIFDLDGTLIDSKLDLALSVNAMLEYMGRAPLPHDRIYGFVGNGAPVLVRRSLNEGAAPGEIADAQVERALSYFLSYYRTHMLDNTVTFPGVREGLALLGGRSMAILTNKPAKFSKAIIDGLELGRYFRYVYGGNSFERKKPDPVGVRVLLRDLDLPAESAMMVGDSEVDVRTARNAGIWACGVTYGLGADGLKANPPDLFVDSLADLPFHLNGTH
ncbi:MAG TPA: HAD-IA family hydrolase [Candidatus Acidoferrum sp.]|nr:HAD-IA family hydrolase [Candidatus Acidoferrum sp.]